jgi:hypothetical protein
MNLRQLFILIMLNLVSVSLFSQKAIAPINYRYPKGQEGFTKYASRIIIYPDSSLHNLSYGLSISKISITPLGEIASIRIVNPVDKYIDAEVIRFLEKTKGKWIKCDSIEKNQVFYVQIAFKFNFSSLSFCESKSIAYNYLFIEPIVITAISFKIPENNVYDDKALAEAGNTLLNEGRYRDALVIINELIKREPFNKDLYKIRILINTNLGRNDFVTEDNLRLTNFAEEYSLDDINEITQDNQAETGKSNARNIENSN